MEWEFKFLSSPDYLRVTVKGQLTLEKQIEMFEEILSLAEWRSGMPILFDNRQLEMKGVKGPLISDSAKIVQEFYLKHPMTKIAGLVVEGVNFGLGRQFEIYTDVKGGADFRLFKDENLALEWLLKPLRVF